MLQAIRSKANTYIVKVLFALLAATFGLWGIGDVFRNWGVDTNVAKVGNIEIGADQVNQAVRNEMAQLHNALGNDIDPEQAKQLGLVDAALQQIVNGDLVDLEANRLGLAIGDEAVRNAILLNPNFKGPSGNFDRNQYTQLLATNQLTEAQFENSLRHDLIRGQLTGAITDGITPPAPLLDTLYRARAERRVAAIVKLTPSAVPAPAPPTDAQLAAFHDAHPDAFRTEERRSFTLALLRLDDVAATIAVPPDKLEAEYRARGDEFQTPEQRELRQMLLPDQSKARAAKAALDAGRDFAAVAKEMADADAASIDLGWVKRDDLPAQLADVAFALPKGNASDPVQTAFGWHILMVTGIKSATTQSFDAVKSRLAQEMARDQAGDVIAKTANNIDDALAGGMSFPAMVQKFGLKTRTVDGIDQQGHGADGKAVDLPAPADAVLRTAFGVDQDHTSELMELGDDGYFVVHVDKVAPSVVTPLAEARGQAVALWQSDQKQQALAQLAAGMVQDVNGGRSLKDVAAAHKFTVATTAPLDRDGTDPSVSPDLVTAVFGAKPDEAVSAPSGDDYVVAQLTGIVPADPAKDAAAVGRLSDEIANEMRNDMLGAFDRTLRARFPVEINQANLDHVL